MTKIQGRKAWQGLDATNLKLLAMALMLCDHIWFIFFQETGIVWFNWLTEIGRLAFPVFAFQITEGFFHTRNIKKYWCRIFLFGLLSEIPFNMMMSMPARGLSYPYHQNVMFTFCIALPFLALLEKARRKGKAVFALTAVCSVVLGFLLGYVTMVDYFGEGVLTVFLFYFCHNMRYEKLGQLLGMILIHVVLMGHMGYTWIYVGKWWTFALPLFGSGWEWMLTEQALAVLALIPIWLYNGKQGRHSKPLQYACYAFYPVHLLILSLLGWLLLT